MYQSQHIYDLDKPLYTKTITDRIRNICKKVDLIFIMKFNDLVWRTI